jgi:hypothetical protein
MNMKEVQQIDVSFKTSQIDGKVARLPANATVTVACSTEGLFLEVAPERSWCNGNKKSCLGSSTHIEELGQLLRELLPKVMA